MLRSNGAMHKPRPCSAAVYLEEHAEEVDDDGLQAHGDEDDDHEHGG